MTGTVETFTASTSPARPIKPAQIMASDSQLAERLGVTRETIRKWHREDPTFPRSRKLSPGCTRWMIAEVDAWVAGRNTAAAD
jgi:prophage regulatory protein